MDPVVADIYTRSGGESVLTYKIYTHYSQNPEPTDIDSQGCLYRHISENDVINGFNKLYLDVHDIVEGLVYEITINIRKIVWASGSITSVFCNTDGTMGFKITFYDELSQVPVYIHFEYITDFAAARADIDTFRYTWDLVNHPLAYKSVVDKRAGNIYGLFIPWLSVDAERVCHITADETDATVTNTFKNTYFNLFEIDHRLDISKQRTLRFRIEGSFKNKEYDPEVYALEYKLEIGKDVFITTEQNGFMINFKGPAVTILSDLFDKFNQENIITEKEDADVYGEDEILDYLILPETAINMYDDYNNTHLTDGSIQLKFIASFSTAIGTKYLYQDDEIPLDPDEDFDPNVYVVIPGDSANDPIYTLNDPVDTDNPTYIVYNH